MICGCASMLLGLGDWLLVGGLVRGLVRGLPLALALLVLGGLGEEVPHGEEDHREQDGDEDLALEEPWLLFLVCLGFLLHHQLLQ